MRKKLRKFSIILIAVLVLSLVLTPAAFARGDHGPRRPQLGVKVDSCIQVTVEWNRRAFISIFTDFVNDDWAFFQVFPHDQSPLTLNYGLPIDSVLAVRWFGPAVFVDVPPCPTSDCYVAPNSQVQDGISVRFLGTGICTTGRLRPKGGGSIVHFPGAVTREEFDLASGMWWYRVYFGGGPTSDLQCKDYHVGVYGQGGGYDVLGFYNPCD